MSVKGNRHCVARTSRCELWRSNVHTGMPCRSLGALPICIRGERTPRRRGDRRNLVRTARWSGRGFSLLLKLLFTSQPLSIQVHPDDAFAASTGMARGKSEAWYVLGATPEARIALGLKQRITPRQLRDAIDDGSIESLVAWRAVSPGDVIAVPAGTITRLAQDLSLLKFSSAAMQRFVCSTTVGSVNFMLKVL